MKSVRDFFYIDDRILRMYFAQLPRKAQMSFRKKHLTTDLEFTLSPTPSMHTKRYRPELPYDASVALALHLESYLQKNEVFSDPETPTEGLVQGTFSVVYTRLATERGDDILIAFPREGIRDRLKRFGKSFYIVGDARKCWNADGSIESHTPGASALQRLFDVWQDIEENREHDIRGFKTPEKGYLWHSGGRRNVFSSLCLIEYEFMDKCFPANLKGILKTKTRFVDDHQELWALYPIILERDQESAV